LVPEIRTNVVYALPSASSTNEVAGVKGRITVVDGKPKASGFPAFGASSHMARVMLSFLKKDGSKKSGIDLMYSPVFEKVCRDYCEEKKLVFVKADRSKEPAHVAEKEGASMPWLVEKVLEQTGGKTPDVCCTVGGEGKEPTTTVYGSDALEVAERAVELAERLESENRKNRLERV
jgi:hydroxymethylpyrimidine/phosphomethylpyrimidine kinase